ncbi:bifunctional non-homologous end joining protein LigD [Amorphus suaedae]
MADLSIYRSKRDFAKTSEPSGDGEAPADGFFVVQKHAARRLHYDFRLAIGGVLASWAVTRGPSLDPSEKRLAVRTEDHPLDYADFEGTIPKGEYGGGTVMVWDHGPFVAEGDPATGLKEGKLALTLAGQRLKGGFALVRMASRRNGDKGRENWLLIKKDDETATTDEVLDQASSVTTGRSMDDITAGKPARAKRAIAKSASRLATSKARASKESAPKASAKSAPKGKPPAFVAPQLATLADDAPTSDGWIYETKFDGYRMIAACDHGSVRCYTRSGKDWTEKFGPIPAALAALDLPDTLLDGEVIVSDPSGRSDFGALQRALKEDPSALSFMVFDILRHDGTDLRGKPLVDRKATLESVLPAKPKAPIHLSTYIDGDGSRISRLACSRGFEGIIAKRADGRYRSTRSHDWLKIKCVKRQEFVIGGWSPSTKARAFSSLLLGVNDNGRLRYCGRVGTGFDGDLLEEIGKRLARHARKTSPFDEVPAAIARSAHWVKPVLVAEVSFAETTRDGSVRHGVFVGLRDDKPASEIVAETPSLRRAMEDDQDAPRPPKRGRGSRKGDGPAMSNEEIQVAGVRLTHPQRVLFPQMNVTKKSLAEYFDAIADVMLPEIEGRAVSLVRCPEGREKACFFQKHAGAGLPDAFDTRPVKERSGTTKDYLVINSREALVACAQVGALEVHIWGSRLDRIERPDRMVFDLDPDEAFGFKDLKAAAVDLAKVLRSAGLESYPLLTGGKGIHLVVTLERRLDWEDVTTFARGFAAKMEEIDPKRFVASMAKKKRTGKIFIDHFRNQFGSTAIAPFSPRSREGAPVAVPVSWDALADIASANAFSVADGGKAIAEQAAAWPAEKDRRQRLTAKSFEALGIDAP